MKKDVSKKNTIFEIEPKIELLQRIMLYEAKKKMFHKENTSHMWKFTEIKRIWKGAEKYPDRWCSIKINSGDSIKN